jgi:GTPase SAR1 family protein
VKDTRHLTDAVQEAETLLRALGENASAQRLASVRQSMCRTGLSLVVFGEFNRGKSTLINALLGRVVLPAKLVPTTGHITSVLHGAPEEVRIRFLDGRWENTSLGQLDSFSSLNDGLARDDIDAIEVAVQAELLQDGLVLVDTPGVSDAAYLTTRARTAVEQADLVIFLLDATQLLGDYERQLAVDWITKELDKPLVPVVNRMNLVEDHDQGPLRERIDRWARQHLPPVLGRPWFEVNALGALRHALGNGRNPPDDFAALCNSLKGLTGSKRQHLQQRSRSGQLRSEIRALREQNHRTLETLRTDADRIAQERHEQRQRLQTQLRWLEEGGRVQNEGLVAYAERQLQEELQQLLAKIREASHAGLKKHCGAWYQQAAEDAVRCVETEGNRILGTLAAEHGSLNTPLDPLTVQERLTLDDRIQVASQPNLLRKVLGDGITDWIERRLGIDHSRPFADSAKEQWGDLRDRVLQILHAQSKARLGVLRRHVEGQLTQLDTLEHVPKVRIEKRAVKLWERRGRPHGQDRPIWLAAEAQLRTELQPFQHEVQQREVLKEVLEQCERVLTPG